MITLSITSSIQCTNWS